MNERTPLRVGILHRLPLVALGLRNILSAQSGIQVQAGSNLTELRGGSDVIVGDFDAGIAAATANARLVSISAPRVLVYTEGASEDHVRRALAAGIHGYVVPGASVAELAEGVRSVAAGQRYLSAVVAHRLAESMSYASLTPRETDVLGGLSGGHCNKSIARQLGISVTTVKAHVTAIMRKMSVDSRTQVVSVAAQRGLVRLTQAFHHEH
jgi:DNA-binding NarL/FixJ family response regulator